MASDEEDQEAIRRELVGWMIAGVAWQDRRTGDIRMTLQLERGDERKETVLEFNECGMTLRAR